MPSGKLTAKQEAFAQALADGLSQAEAYRLAYDAENMGEQTLWNEASKLAAHNEVSLRVAELKQAIAERALWSREMSVKALVQAYKEGSGSVKVAAVKELNAMHGYNEPAKVEIGGRMIHKIVQEVVDPKDAD